MPLYEFICTACDCMFEEILPADHTEPPACPRCTRTEHVHKQLSACVTRTGSSSCVPNQGFS